MNYDHEVVALIAAQLIASGNPHYLMPASEVFTVAIPNLEAAARDAWKLYRYVQKWAPTE